MRAFDVLPQVIQINWGGGPWRRTIATKSLSLSLLMTTAFARRAASKISSSFASCSPGRCAEVAVMSGKVSLIYRPRAGDSWASIQRFTRR